MLVWGKQKNSAKAELKKLAMLCLVINIGFIGIDNFGIVFIFGGT